MSSNRDQVFISELAKSILKELRRRQINSPLQLLRQIKLKKKDDGWSATLGSFDGYQCNAEIWLDRFTAYSDRKIYYCLFSEESKGLAELVRTVSHEFGKHLPIGDKDRSLISSGYFSLSRKLPKSRFGHPIYERYPSGNEYIYGIYEFDKTGLQKNVFSRLVERSVDFFQTITEAVTNKHPKHDHKPPVQDYETYQSVENRQAVSNHIRRERKSHVATLCKQRDNFICKVCSFDFSKTYGKLGTDFAEAHHIVPLSSNEKLRNTTVEDLITVCANCHRMLHRMDGKSNDVEKLKKIMGKNNRK